MCKAVNILSVVVRDTEPLGPNKINGKLIIDMYASSYRKKKTYDTLWCYTGPLTLSSFGSSYKNVWSYFLLRSSKS